MQLSQLEKAVFTSVIDDEMSLLLLPAMILRARRFLRASAKSRGSARLRCMATPTCGILSVCGDNITSETLCQALCRAIGSHEFVMVRMCKMFRN